VEGPFGPQQSSQSVRILSPPQASSSLLTPGQSGSRRSPPGSPGSVQAAARDPASCKPSASADSPHSRPRVTTRPTRRLLPFGADPLRLLEAAEKMVSGEVPTRRVRTQAIESAGTDQLATGKLVSLVWDPPRRFARRDPRRTCSDGFASAKRAGRFSSEIGRADRTHHAARRSDNTRIETLRRQAIEGTASTPRGLPSLERLRPLERPAPRALQRPG